MRTALYARVSTASEEQGLALQQQLARLREAAKADTATEYIDIASGSRDDRPQLEQLMEACRSGDVDRVIVTRLDRMTRSMSHGAELLAYFAAEDTPNLIALDDGLDLSTVGGRFVANMLINLGQAETERLSERVRHGKADARLHLKPFGPKAPFGYRWTADRSNYELDPEASVTARLVVDRFLETGQVLKTLRYAQTLPHNRLSTTAGFRAWIMSPSLMGYRCYGSTEKYRDKGGKLKRRTRLPGDFEQVIPQAHPALISEVEHARICAVIEEHRHRAICGIQKNFTRELTGLVVCGHCGHRMTYYFRAKGKPTHMRCVNLRCELNYKNVVLARLISEAIWSKLQAHRLLLARAAMGHQWREGSHTDEINKLLSSIKQLQEMNDPMLWPVIAAKEEQLELLLQAVRQQPTPWSWEAVSNACSDPRFWELAKGDPVLTRRFFTDYVKQVVVRNREVESVQLRC
ncbi:MAG: recombinase family protein [Prochlorococcaceae cyanobacterium]